jgi:hypothetical protein
MPEFSTPASPGTSAFAQYPVQHHVDDRGMVKFRKVEIKPL